MNQMLYTHIYLPFCLHIPPEKPTATSSAPIITKYVHQIGHICQIFDALICGMCVHIYAMYKAHA